MDFWASIEHKIRYKYQKDIPEHMKRELKECADIVKFLDRKMLALNEEIAKESVEEDDYDDMIHALKEMIQHS